MRRLAASAVGGLFLAVAAIALAVTESPERETGVVGEALAALDEGRAADALELLEAATLVDGPRRFAVWSLLGRAQLRLGQPEAAAHSFDEALSRAPGFVPARLGKAEADIGRGSFPEGLAALEQLASQAAPPSRAVNLLAGLRLFLDELDAARTLWRQLADKPGPERWSAGLMLLATDRSLESRDQLFLEAERDLSSASAYLALGVERQLAGQLPPAAQLFRIAFEIDEHDPIARLLLERAEGRSPARPAPIPGLERRVAEIFVDWTERDRVEAADAAREILALRPHHAPLALLVARVAEERGDNWGAFDGYERLIERIGALPLVAAGAARAALRAGAFGVAQCRARAALRLRPDDTILLRLLAAARSGSGARNEAVAILREAIASEPSSAASWRQLGDALFDGMRADEAVEAYRRALELEPGSVVEIPGFALAALVSDGSLDLDAELLTRHIERHPGSVDALYPVAVARLRAGELDAAERLLQELAAAEPGNSRAAYNLAQVYQRQGRLAEARAQMQSFEGLKAAEDADWELHNQAHFRRLEAREHEVASRPGEALALYLASAEEGTADVGDYLAIARLHLAGGRATDAGAWLERLLEASPYERDALELQASVDRLLGRTADLEHSLRKLELLERSCSESLDRPPS